MDIGALFSSLTKGITGSLGFGSNKTSSNSSGTSVSTGTSSSDTTSVKMDEESKAALDALMQQLSATVAQGTGDKYSKETAVKDSADVVKQLFTQYSESTLPEILSAQAESGMYSSTAAKQLSNDAFARTTAQAASVVSDNIIKYAQLGQDESQQGLDALISVLGLQADAFGKVSEASKFDTRTDTTSASSSKSKSRSFDLKFG